MDTTRHSLLIRVKNEGDNQAWSEFDGLYRPLLVKFARARGLWENEAEEMAQECMTAVHRYIGGFEYDPSRGRFKAWLRTMVNNRVKNLIRDRRDEIAKTRDLHALEEPAETPEAMFDRVWRLQHLKHCLNLIRSEVEPATFDVFMAYAMEDRSVESICKEFGMTANRVHAIKSRMLGKIRERMTKLLGEGEDD